MKAESAGAWGRGLRALFDRYKFVLLVILAGGILLLLPSLGGGTGEEGGGETVETVRTDGFGTEELERKMEEALSRIEGVGEVRVLLTLQSGPRRIVAQDTESTAREGETDASVSTVVISGGSGGEETVTLQQLSPQYQGALVVCSGGGDPAIRLSLVEAVSALTGLGADKISVCKGK